MNDSIELHPTKGLNPKLTTCPICGEAGSSLILAGRRDWSEECPSCGVTIFGGLRASERCPKCQGHGPGLNRRQLPERQLPLPDPCGRCTDKMKTQVALILVDGEPPAGRGQRLGPVVFQADADIRRVFRGDVVEQILKRRAVFVPLEVWTAVGLPSVDDCKRIAAEGQP